MNLSLQTPELRAVALFAIKRSGIVPTAFSPSEVSPKLGTDGTVAEDESEGPSPDASSAGAPSDRSLKSSRKDFITLCEALAGYGAIPTSGGLGHQNCDPIRPLCRTPSTELTPM